MKRRDYVVCLCVALATTTASYWIGWPLALAITCSAGIIYGAWEGTRRGDG